MYINSLVLPVKNCPYGNRNVKPIYLILSLTHELEQVFNVGKWKELHIKYTVLFLCLLH